MLERENAEVHSRCCIFAVQLGNYAVQDVEVLLCAGDEQEVGAIIRDDGDRDGAFG